MRTSPSSAARTGIESSVTLPKQVTDALEILLITKDNLAGYHRELVEHFILDDKWGRWLGRWTAEEHLHAVALRNYLVVTREIDPTRQRGRPRRARDEGLPRRQAQPDRDAGLHGVLRARARRVLPQPAGADRPSRCWRPWSVGSPRTRSVTRSSSRTSSRTASTTKRDETSPRSPRRAAAFETIGADIDAYAGQGRASSPKPASSMTPHSARCSPIASTHGVSPTHPELAEFVAE